MLTKNKKKKDVAINYRLFQNLHRRDCQKVYNRDDS